LPVTACRILGAEVVIAANPNGRIDGTLWSEREASLPTFWKSWGERLKHLPAGLSDLFDSGPEEEPAPQYLDVIAASIDIMTDGIRRAKLAGDPPHVLLDAHLAGLSVLDFHCAREAIEEGRRVVKDNAEAIARSARL
jgi:NTE family protein